MQNPLLKIRKDKGLTVHDLSLLVGISDVTLRKIEKGVPAKLSRSLLNALERMGYDQQQFAEDYKHWKKIRLKELESKVIS